MREQLSAVPVRVLFREGKFNPDYQTLVEWHISGSSGGKDGKGVAVVHNLQNDSLEFQESLTLRTLEWSLKLRFASPDIQDPYTLNSLPDESLYRAYLEGRALFNLRTRQLEYKLKPAS